jgi:hypothetical protein
MVWLGSEGYDFELVHWCRRLTVTYYFTVCSEGEEASLNAFLQGCSAGVIALSEIRRSVGS